MHWHASSITARSNCRCPRISLSSPVSVAHRTVAPFRMRSTASASSWRESSSSARPFLAKLLAHAGLRFAARPLAGLAEQARTPSWPACVPGACRRDPPPAGRACARAAPARRGPDGRAAPRVRRAASRRSSRLSTARLLGRTPAPFCPRRTAWRISSTTVVVLPVPGGPCRMATSLADSAKRMASCCEAFSEPSSGTNGRFWPESGPASPSRTRRNSASRSRVPCCGLARGRELPLPGGFIAWTGRVDNFPAVRRRRAAHSTPRATPCDCVRRRRRASLRPSWRRRPREGPAPRVPVDSTATAMCDRLASVKMKRPPRPDVSSTTTSPTRQSPDGSRRCSPESAGPPPAIPIPGAERAAESDRWRRPVQRCRRYTRHAAAAP